MSAPIISTRKPPPKQPAASPVTQRPITVAGKPAKTVSAARVKKNFSVGKPDRRGKKIIVYADSGMGKTTVAMLLNDPIFVPTDNGVDVMVHPVTGEQLNIVKPYVRDFYDIRDVINSNTFDPHEDIVFDTVTEVVRWAAPYTCETVHKSKSEGGGTAKHLEDYGWRNGWRHWFETMELFLSDLNQWVYKGKNVVLLAQSNAAKINNDGGADYLKAAPDLYHGKSDSILNLVTQWSDHIFRINYTNLVVDKQKVSTSEQRAIFIHGRAEFMAKSRTISSDFPCVEFKDKTDDSIWRLLFGGE